MYSITYVLVHMQRKRKQSFKRFAFFVCVNVGQKTVYAAATFHETSRSYWVDLVYSSFSCLLFVSLDQFGT